MATVFLAHDLKHHRSVAIKVLRPEVAAALGADRFLREIEIAARLTHPHILPLHDSGEAAGSLYYVMPYIGGESLRERLDRETRLPLEDTLRVGREVADALAHAHRHDVVHRDVKPENILLAEGHAVVADFGIARAVNAAAGEKLTQTGLAIGTMAYMSPEQASNTPVGASSDIFSLGIMLYELATGHHPFAAGSEISVLHGILSQPALPPSRLNPEIPTNLDAAILGMLEKDPELRPSATEAQRALTDLARKSPSAVTAPPRAPAERHMVGRERERAGLRAGFEAAAAGRGLLLCVAGEPGIGKTTLVEDFLEEVAASGQPCRLARGRCSERLAGTEAYLPFLEALDGLLHGESGGAAARTLRVLAPTWYGQIVPVSAHDPSAAQLLVDTRAASQERMKRELVAFLHEASRLHPLVLFFDDVHWADASTVDLIAYLASHFESLRLLLVVSYRPSDLLLTKHPFLQIKLDLQARGVCREIGLLFLGRDDIETYLALEYPQHDFPPALPVLIHGKTEGSPLFMVDLIRYLRDRGVIGLAQGRWTLAQSVPEIERELPESVRSMIEKKIGQLEDADRRLLVAASVQGAEFDSAVVAKALDLDAADVEERLQLLDRVHAFVRLLREREFPDRTLTLRYRFVHVLYQNALYASLTPTRRASLSRAVADALLGYYGEQSSAIGSELALLFEAARDAARAAAFFLVAAKNAAQIFAYQEAVLLARRGLELLKALPESPESARQELMLQITLGGLLIVTKGGGVLEVEEAYARARALCQQVGDTPELFTALRGLSEYYHTHAELETGLELAQQALAVAQRLALDALIVDAYHAVAMPLLYLGELRPAWKHLEEGIALYDPQQHRVYLTLYHAIAPGVGCRFQASRVLWLLGHPDQALEHVQAGISLAQKLSHHYSLAMMHVAAAMLRQCRREPQRTLEHADAAIALAREHELPEVLAWAGIWRGWALAAQGRIDEGIAVMRECTEGLRAHRASRPHQLALLAEALGRAGHVEEALATLAEALAEAETGGRYYKAELHRLKGELLLMHDREALIEAETTFRQAIDIARSQLAKSLELRAVTSLSRVWERQGNRAEARRMLEDVADWFTEGFDTLDLQEAKAFLQEMR